MYRTMTASSDYGQPEVSTVLGGGKDDGKGVLESGTGPFGDEKVLRMTFLNTFIDVDVIKKALNAFNMQKKVQKASE